MALRKKNGAPADTVAEETKVEETKAVEEAAAEETPVADGKLTDAEKEVLASGAGDGNLSVANTKKLELANELVAKQFNIDSTFYLTQSKDSGKSMTLGFANGNYEVTIKIKDTEEMGLIPD